MSDTQNLASKTVSSVAWTYGSYVLTKGTVLITTAILARLITRGEFGIVGFAVTTMSFLDAVRDLGIGLALIQRRDDVETAASTAFWMNIMSNLVIWLLAVLASPFVANFFREPLVTTVLPILSINFLISSLGGVHDALLQREMQFSKRIIPAISEALSKGGVSIAIALLGGGVWALVFGQIVGRFAYAAVAWQVMPWRPAFEFSVPIARELFSFGYKISLDSLISNFQANIDYVFIGRFLGSEGLGLYTIAYRIPEMIIINLCIVIAQVLFPAYSILQTDPEQLKRGMLATLRYISIVTFPVGLGLALVSLPFTRVVFGSDWDDAAPIMAMLALYGVFLAVSWNIGDVYKAVNRPDILWKTAVFEFALLGPTLYVLAQDSPLAVATGHAIIAAIVSVIRLIIASILIELSLVSIARQFIPSGISAGVMGVAVYGTLYVFEDSPSLLQLVAGVVVGGVSYLGLIALFERELVDQLRIRFFKKEKSTPRSEATS